MKRSSAAFLGLVVSAGLLAAARGVAPEPADAGFRIEGLLDVLLRPAPGSDRTAKRLPPSLRRLLADFAWLAAVQHHGNRRRAGEPGYPRLLPLVGLALRLDPGLRPAAVHGALLVAEPPPFGSGRPRAAAAMLERWVAEAPRDWEARVVLGLIHSWHLHDPKTAARLFEAGARRRDPPDWFRGLAARSWAEAGRRDAARALWRALLAGATGDRERENARIHLLQLDALDELDALAARAEEFRARTGAAPSGFGDLVAAGLLPGAPEDPAGIPYVFDPDSGPGISPRSPLAGAPRR